MAGLVLFGLGSLFSAYSHSPDQLIAARAVMGLGGAAVMPQTLSIIANVFEPARAGPRHRHLDLRRRHRRGHRPGARRPAAHPLLVGLGLPDQRPGDGRRRGRRALPGARVPQPRAGQDRLPRRARLHPRPGAARLRDRAGRRRRVVGQPRRARPGARRPRRARPVRLVREPHRAPEPRRPAVQEPHPVGLASARSRCCSSAWAASTSSPASTCRTSAVTARWRPALLAVPFALGQFLMAPRSAVARPPVRRPRGHGRRHAAERGRDRRLGRS